MEARSNVGLKKGYVQTSKEHYCKKDFENFLNSLINN